MGIRCHTKYAVALESTVLYKDGFVNDDLAGHLHALEMVSFLTLSTGSNANPFLKHSHRHPQNSFASSLSNLAQLS